ncbi:hypothetical protein F5984_20635 [Rudanella paleaurantiibacter]|uniref:Uncharacterized protein n=1 Tax=Rudanella paleaurantiibacter TaxID=2614655 RepID=A0A7J5TVI3_9BACT|nr:hypothetical protein [Rudanella paleaurantiibacter]KAB7728155.1 hypothetical protein F5984_20635 [Rudanella paleaurantiibacter]
MNPTSAIHSILQTYYSANQDGHPNQNCVLHFSEVTLELLDQAVTKLLVAHLAGAPVGYRAYELVDLDSLMPTESGNHQLSLWDACLFRHFASFLYRAQELSCCAIIREYSREQILSELAAFLATPITRVFAFPNP